MAQTTSSVGLMQKSGGTEKPHATHLPPQRRGFPLTGWRSSDTTPFEQAVAGPRCKWPRVQITDHPLPHDGGLRRAQHTHHPPNAVRGEAWLTQPSAAQDHGTAAPTALGPSPVLAQHAVPTDSQPASASPCSASLWSSSHSCADTRLLLLLLHASAMAAQVTAGVAANP